MICFVELLSFFSLEWGIEMATQIQDARFINFSDFVKREALPTDNCQLCGTSHPFHEMHAFPSGTTKRRCHSCYAKFGGAPVKTQFKQMQMELQA